MMACIQPANDKAVTEPNYDVKAVSEINSSHKVHEQANHMKRKTIIHTSDDDKIDSNIIFDDPYVENNGGTSEHDSNVHDEYHAIQILAYNVKREAENQKRLNNELKKQKELLQKELETCQSIQTIHMLGKTPNKVYDPFRKAGLGYQNLKSLKKAIAAQPKMYHGEMLYSTKIKINSPDYEETLEDAKEKPSVKQTYFSFPSTSHECSESKEVMSDLQIPKMPNESKLLGWFEKMNLAINDLRDRIDVTLLEDRKRIWMSDSQNSLREFYKTDVILMSVSLSKTLKELQQELIKEVQEMLNNFESIEQKVKEKSLKENIFQNEINRLLEVSLIRENQDCVLISVEEQKNKLLKNKNEKNSRDSKNIQANLLKRIKILENDFKRSQAQSIDFELKLQHQKEKMACDVSWKSRLSTLNDENTLLKTQVYFVVQERENIKLEYQKLFNSIKATDSTSTRDVFMLSHEKCVARYALSRFSRVKRALFATPVAAKSKNLGTTFVVAKSRLSVAKTPTATNKVIQLVLWIVDSGCSTHMTSNLKLLRNFVEKFMGTVRFGNDHFTAITRYGDYVQGNLTMCHVYYVEGLRHILFSVGQFCDGDLEVAFCSSTCYVWNLKGDDLLTGPGLNCLNFQDSSEELNEIPSQQDLDNLFGPLYAEYYALSTSKVSNNSTANTLDDEDTPSPSSIIVEDNDALQMFKEAESSSNYQDPSNMHEFHQQHRYTDKWTKSHPIKQVIGDHSKPVQTRNQLRTDAELCMYALTMKFFLGLQIYKSPHGIFINQSQYTMKLLRIYEMEKYDTVTIPMAIAKIDADLQGTPTDQTKYHSMIGRLMYLTASRPDIAFATFICARYQARPTVKHLKEVKRIFWYLQQSINKGLWYSKDSGFELIAYSDADLVGCLDDYKRTSRGLQFLGDKLVS
ncbi:hypothetical protein Tco_0491185 [Tanacetum coccineum]